MIDPQLSFLPDNVRHLTSKPCDIIQGDCLAEMRKMADNSIDFVVTDPPYGISFMSMDFDRFKDQPAFNPEVWKEALRICKPGSMLAAFGGDRTHHHLMNALEAAGWEIRTCIYWIFGSGFPKGLDISKGIDKKRKDGILHVCKFLRDEIEKKQMSFEFIKSHFDFNAHIDKWAAKEDHCDPRIPPNKTWFKLKDIIGFSDEMDREVIRLNNRKGQWGDNAFLRGLEENQGHGWFKGNQCGNEPILPLAQTFEGYGTALKPAAEIIVLAMKPLEGTFAQNAEKWGVAGINIDGSRIGTTETIKNHARSSESAISKGIYGDSTAQITHQTDGQKLGRWPANVILDEEAGEQLGSPSRFFYCAKASSRERNEGCEGLEAKESECNLRQQGGLSKPHNEFSTKNNHPTVKPISLMKYIIKLLAPPGDPILLDPFAGSGSTLVAAKQLGVQAIGIELSEEYCEIAKARIAATIDTSLTISEQG